jgi:hypothetical protein
MKISFDSHWDLIEISLNMFLMRTCRDLAWDSDLGLLDLVQAIIVTVKLIITLKQKHKSAVCINQVFLT